MAIRYGQAREAARRLRQAEKSRVRGGPRQRRRAFQRLLEDSAWRQLMVGAWHREFRNEFYG